MFCLLMFRIIITFTVLSINVQNNNNINGLFINVQINNNINVLFNNVQNNTLSK